MTAAGVQRRFSGNDSGSGTTEHDGSWQHTRIKFAARSRETTVENQAEHEEITSMKRFRGETVSRNSSMADIESKRPCEVQHSHQLQSESRVQDNGVEMRNTKARWRRGSQLSEEGNRISQRSLEGQ